MSEERLLVGSNIAYPDMQALVLKMSIEIGMLY